MELTLPLKCEDLPAHGRCLGAGDEGRVFTMRDGRTMKQMVLNNASRHEVRAHAAIYAGIRSRTPCVTPMYDRWRCDSARMDPCSAAPAAKTKRRQRRGVVYAVMQHAAHGDLAHFVRAHRADPRLADYLRSILLQLLHALHVAQERLQMTHWDLHDENVLIHRTATKTRTLRIGSHTWTVPTYGFCPMLYDFGFAYVGRPWPAGDDRAGGGSGGTPIERIWTRKIRATLGVRDFKPFSTGYDQAVLGAYLYNDLVEHKIAAPALRRFLRDGIGPARVMRRAIDDDSLRPVGCTSAELDAFGPLDAMRHPFFAALQKKSSAPRPRAPSGATPQKPHATPRRGVPAHTYNLRPRAPKTGRRPRLRPRRRRHKTKTRAGCE